MTICTVASDRRVHLGRAHAHALHGGYSENSIQTRVCARAQQSHDRVSSHSSSPPSPPLPAPYNQRHQRSTPPPEPRQHLHANATTTSITSATTTNINTTVTVHLYWLVFRVVGRPCAFSPHQFFSWTLTPIPVVVAVAVVTIMVVRTNSKRNDMQSSYDGTMFRLQCL